MNQTEAFGGPACTNGHLPTMAIGTPAGCFTATTPVLMADGTTTRLMTDLRIGDDLLTYNRDTGVSEPSRVTDVFTYPDVATIDVDTLYDGSITTTADHRFYVLGKGYVPAQQLEARDWLQSWGTAHVEVTSIRPTGRAETVHNLTVDSNHNYYVSTPHPPRPRPARPVLVHTDSDTTLFAQTIADIEHYYPPSS